MDNYKQIRVVLSTLGPLHLIKSAEYLSKLVDINVVQGWIPKWWNKWILSIASKIQHRDIYKTIKKRTPDCLYGRNHSVALPDIIFWARVLFKLGSRQKASTNAALMYGKMSQKYIKDADIYHVRSGSGGNGAIETARSRGMKVIVDHSIAHPAFMDMQLRPEYERNGERFDLGLSSPFWQGIVEECEKTDVLLVNSDFVKKTFVDNGFCEDKIKVVYLGVRVDFVGLKKDWSLENETLRILFTGGFGIRKGAEYILRALCALDSMNVQYEMTVVGTNSADSMLRQYAPAHIKFVNTIPQNELKAYLANSDVYLFPSLCEGCASSGMEALAAGLPVIATEESGLPIVNGENGVIVESKNVDAIVDAILTLKDNCHLREHVGLNAMHNISTNYTWKRYADEVVKIYKSVL